VQGNDLGDYLGFRNSRQASETDQHDPEVDSPLSVDQLAEVFVLGEEQGLVLVGALEHDIVSDAGFHFRHKEYRVPIVPEPIHDLLLYALIGQQIHAACSGTG
jgi:hypothetical protein